MIDFERLFALNNIVYGTSEPGVQDDWCFSFYQWRNTRYNLISVKRAWHMHSDDTPTWNNHE